jgi:hypothetical protein
MEPNIKPLQDIDSRNYCVVQDPNSYSLVIPKVNCLLRAVSGQMEKRPETSGGHWEELGKQPFQLIEDVINKAHEFKAIEVALTNHSVAGIFLPHWFHLGVKGDGTKRFPVKTNLKLLSVQTPSLYVNYLSLGGASDDLGFRTGGCEFDFAVGRHEMRMINQSRDVVEYALSPFYDHKKGESFPRMAFLEAENPVWEVPSDLFQVLKKEESVSLHEVSSGIFLVEQLA